MSCYVENLGALFDVLTKALAGFMAVMLATFWLGMLTRRATTASTITCALFGVAVAMFLGYPELLSFGYLPEKTIGFIWIATVTLLTTLLVGVLLDTSRPGDAVQRWNWRAIMKIEMVE